MKSDSAGRGVRRIARAVAVGLIAAAAGCEDWDKDFHHTPPPGMGSLIVDNRTSDEVNVIVDGADKGRVDSYDDKTCDLAPGLHRVMFDQHHGDRDGVFDFTTATGRVTILHLEVADSDWDDYSASFDVD